MKIHNYSLYFKILILFLHPNFSGGSTVDYLRQFVIPFSGLKTGEHLYSFDIEDKFFEHFEYSEIKEGKVQVDVVMDKQARMLVFNLGIHGTVKVPCDHCGEEYEQPVDGMEKLIVKFGDAHHEETDEIFMITEDEHEIDLSQFIYEYIHLLLPFRRVHSTDENGNSLCIPDVAGFISDESGDEAIDPRWEALKNIKGKNKKTDK